MKEVIFLSGIDTDAGKTYATAFLTRRLSDSGLKVITQKFIQTGCTESSEDIETHRRLCGTGLLPEDLDGTTAPVIFTYPASAQLAARIDGREIDLEIIDRATAKLLESYDTVIIEGAGGLMVPVDDNTFTIDYVTSRRLPMVLVTNSRLGSINHTVLSLEAIKVRGIELKAVIFNHHFDNDPIIAVDTRAFTERYLKKHFPKTEIIDMPSLT